MTVPARPTAAALALLGVFLAAGAVPAWAASARAPAAATLNADDRAEIGRVEQYMNGIQTMQSKFIQVNPNGQQIFGTFSLLRPGKMRLDYDPPIKDFIVADGLFLFYWDGEMRQQSSTPIGATLADFILRPDIRLSGDVTVTDVTRGSGVIEITVVETKEPAKGSLTLVFEDKPLQLRKWRVLDAQGQVTEVGLLNPRVGLSLDRDMFYFKEPARERFNHQN